MKCAFIEIEQPNERGKRRVKCSRCGLTLAPTGSPLDRIHAVCSVPGWGDRVEWCLSWLGITVDRWRWVKSLFGVKSESCDPCKRRKELLNKLGG